MVGMGDNQSLTSDRIASRCMALRSVWGLCPEITCFGIPDSRYLQYRSSMNMKKLITTALSLLLVSLVSGVYGQNATANITIAGIDFGDNSSQWANDGECDDPRFEGDGMATSAIEDDLHSDATDCSEAYQNGSIALIGNLEEELQPSNQEQQTALEAERFANLVRGNGTAGTSTADLNWFCSGFLIRTAGIFEQDYSLLGADMVSAMQEGGERLIILAALDGPSDAAYFGQEYANMITNEDVFESMLDSDSLLRKTIMSCVER